MNEILIAGQAIVPSNPKDKTTINGAIREIADCLTRIESERELIADIAAGLKEEYDLPKRLVNKMASVYFKGNHQEVTAEMEEFETFFEAIMKKD